MVWASFFTPVNYFLKHVLIYSTRIFPYCRKVATTLWTFCRRMLPLCCGYVFLPFCGNVVATLLKLPQRCGNVFATFEYDVEATSGGNIFTTVAQHLSSVPGLRCSNVSRQHFHNFRSTLWQRSRNFHGIRWCNATKCCGNVTATLNC